MSGCPKINRRPEVPCTQTKEGSRFDAYLDPSKVFLSLLFETGRPTKGRIFGGGD